MKRRKLGQQGLDVSALGLSESAWSELNKALASFKTAGLRYTEAGMQFIDKTE